MANTSQRIQDIKRELRAQKMAFQRASNTLPLYTKTLTFNTKKNACHVEDLWYPGSDYDYEGYERIVVTLDTTSGANTLANLEMSIKSNSSDFPLITRRVPYSGGARWIVMVDPNYIMLDRTWITTTIEFSVHSLVDGTLSAKMIWE